MTGIEKVVDMAGSQSALARELGVAHQVANRWVRRGYVPARRALEIEIKYGVPAHDLAKPSLMTVAELLTGDVP